jgi:hypothetical protein
MPALFNNENLHKGKYVSKSQTMRQLSSRAAPPHTSRQPQHIDGSMPKNEFGDVTAITKWTILGSEKARSEPGRGS